MRVSIIVPVLNEAPIIGEFLVHLRQRAPGAQIIVVDGGSIDGTLESCKHHGIYAQAAPAGRAKQMNAGAKIASGDILWFVHADSRIAPDGAARIKEALTDPRVVGGCFRLRIDSPRLIYRLRDLIGNALVSLTDLALGDRGFFCRREVFEKIGGYPEIEILEDAEFYRALREHGRVRQLRTEIKTSARRYEVLGPARTVFFYGLVMALYALRVPLATLGKLVRRYVKSRGRSSVSASAKNLRKDRRTDRPRVPLAE